MLDIFAGKVFFKKSIASNISEMWRFFKIKKQTFSFFSGKEYILRENERTTI